MKQAHIREEENFVLCAVCEGENLTRVYRFPKDGTAGSVVLGKVKFVKREVGVFVDVGLERDGILDYRPGLKSGDDVLVRIETEPREDRGCSLSEKINLVGKYVVLLEGSENRFSKEIGEERRAELSSYGKYPGVGFLYRSLANEGEDEAIERERKETYDRYVELRKIAKTSASPKLLYRQDPLTMAKNLAENYDFDFTSVRKQIEELSQRKISVSGAELVFDKTEAGTMVDVNFHAAEERGKEAVFTVNKRAIVAFARQVRLRNLSGIIILDYIGMEKKKERELYDFFREEVAKDYVRCQTEHAERSGLFILIRPERYTSF